MCSWLAAGYAASPHAWPAWVYYAFAFGGCTGPIGFLLAKERGMAQSASEATAIEKGSVLYSLIAVLAYVGFSIWPSVAAPLYGWVLIGDRDERPASSEVRSFKCKEPLPAFTLGPTSNPSDEKVQRAYTASATC